MGQVEERGVRWQGGTGRGERWGYKVGKVGKRWVRWQGGTGWVERWGSKAGDRGEMVSWETWEEERSGVDCFGCGNGSVFVHLVLLKWS